MEHKIRMLRLKFNKSLEPIKVMLVNRREKLPYGDWLQFVEHTKSSVLVHPDQYLGEDIPSPEVLTTIIDKIFEDFLNDLHFRSGEVRVKN